MNSRLSATGLGARRAVLILLALALGVLVMASASAGAATPAEFGYEGDGAGGFSEANGIAVDQQSGDVYLGDRNNNRVDQFGPEGEFIRAWGWGVADGASEEFQVCTSVCFAGLAGSGAGQLTGPEGIAVDNDLASSSHGDVYVVDRGNSRIEKFSASGEFLLAFGEAGSGPGQFEGLTERSVSVGPEGSVYVGDENRVQRFTPNGSLEGQFSVSGAGRIEELAVDSAGDVYLVSSELSGVRKFDPSGAELGEPRDSSASTFYFTIAIGPGNKLFVNEGEGSPSSPHHILTFSPSGEELSSFDAGQESGGRGIAYGDAAGVIYVLNRASVRTVQPPAAGPLVVIGSEYASEIEPTTVTLNATLNPEGGAETTYRFEYGTEAGVYTEETTAAELTGGPFEDQPVSAAIASLQPRTTYHFRVVATNAAHETTVGPDQTFTTLPPVSVDSASASEITSSSALLEAELNPHGLATVYRVEYDTSEYQEGEGPHGASTASAQAGSGTTDKAVAVQVQGLMPATTYHFRFVAENALGVVRGPDRSFRTQGPANALLPDGRAWELVSPPDKNGVSLEALAAEGGTTQAAADGSGIAYIANGAIDPEPAGNASVDLSQLLARRSSSGWLTEDITTPHAEPTGAKPGFKGEYKLFSPDLNLAAVEPTGATPLSPLVGEDEELPYLRQSDGSFTPFVYPGNVPAGTDLGHETEPGIFFQTVKFVGANPTLTHVVIRSGVPLISGVSSGPGSLYDWSGGALSLVSEVPPTPATRCGGSGPTCVPAANEGETSELGPPQGGGNRNAVSSDGSRFIFSVSQHLFLRDAARGETIQLDARQAGAAGGVGVPIFQTASTDGSRVFFADASRLTRDATAREGEPDLYMCDVEESEGHLTCKLSDLSTDPEQGGHAHVLGTVLAAAGDGSSVYFVANGALTPDAAHGTCGGETAENTAYLQPPDSACNLYRYDTATEEVELVAVLAGRDGHDWANELGLHTSRISPNGRWLAFMSQRPLTGYDNRDARTGRRDEEVFLYDAETQKLHCVSCNPSGARPLGQQIEVGTFLGQGPLGDRFPVWRGESVAGSIPGWTHVAAAFELYQSRYLSNSGRIFFDAADALVPADSNRTEDVYQYEPLGVGGCTEQAVGFSAASSGCVDLISSGTSGEESAFLDASESGDDVFFLTASKLAPADVDGALDLYDAHVCTSARPCPSPPAAQEPECDGDAC